MTDLLTVPLDELAARRDSAREYADRPDCPAFAREAHDALDALIRLRTANAPKHGKDGGA
jgi:hypothetical protein